ncbi:uncharacterized protein METZ01_LOCUS294298, partial [marine metagenome]
VYPIFSNREPAPAIGISIFIVPPCHFGLISCFLKLILSINSVTYLNVVLLTSVTGHKYAPLLSAPFLPIWESSTIIVSSGLDFALIIHLIYISALGLDKKTSSLANT